MPTSDVTPPVSNSTAASLNPKDVPDRLYAGFPRQVLVSSIILLAAAAICLLVFISVPNVDERITETQKTMFWLSVLGMLIFGITGASLWGFAHAAAKLAAGEERTTRTQKRLKLQLDARMSERQFVPLATYTAYVYGTAGHIPFRRASGEVVHVQVVNNPATFQYDVLMKAHDTTLPYTD